MFVRSAFFRLLLLLLAMSNVSSDSTGAGVSSVSSTAPYSTLLEDPDIRGDAEFLDWVSFYHYSKYVASLKDALSASNGPFTIFVPSLAAFETLGYTVPTKCLLFGTNEKEYNEYNDYYKTNNLASILLYHVIQGTVVFSSDFINEKMIPTMNGESVEISGNTSIVTVNGVVVNDGMSAIATSNGNVIYEIDRVLLPPSFVTNLPDILAACNEPFANKYCKGQREKFDFAGTQNCASCGGYFQEDQNCYYAYPSKSLRQDRLYCIDECQWFNAYCTEECCWDTHAEQPELAQPFEEECFPEQCWRSEFKSWTVAPCDPNVTIHAGWHVAKKSKQFNRQRSKKCDVQEFAKQNSLTSVWHADCTTMWQDIKYFSSCDDRNMAVAVWMVDKDGNFAGYYIDPHEQKIGPTSDTCLIEEKIRIMIWLVPSLILVLIMCCCCFFRWREMRRNLQNPTAALDDEFSLEDNNTAVDSDSVDNEKS